MGSTEVSIRSAEVSDSGLRMMTVHTYLAVPSISSVMKQPLPPLRFRLHYHGHDRYINRLRSDIMAAKVNIAAQSEPKNAGELPPELMALHDKLDSLWERYLNLLDTYQVAQKELQKQMSSVRSPTPNLF